MREEDSSSHVLLGIKEHSQFRTWECVSNIRKGRWKTSSIHADSTREELWHKRRNIKWTQRKLLHQLHFNLSMSYFLQTLTSSTRKSYAFPSIACTYPNVRDSRQRKKCKYTIDKKNLLRSTHSRLESILQLTLLETSSSPVHVLLHQLLEVTEKIDAPQK